jgi:hypothetical protein
MICASIAASVRCLEKNQIPARHRSHTSLPTMPAPPFRVYLLDESLAQDHVDRLLHTFATTSALPNVNTYLQFEAHRPSRALKTDTEIIDYHFETRLPTCPIWPVLVLDSQTKQDNTVKLVAKPVEKDEVELSDDEDSEPVVPPPPTISCRLEPGYVNIITANMSIGKEYAETVRAFRLSCCRLTNFLKYIGLAGPDGVFRGFPPRPGGEPVPPPGGAHSPIILHSREK